MQSMTIPEHMYIGSRCRHGHDGLRYKAGSRCVKCANDKSRERASTPEGREKKRLAYWKFGGREDRRNRNLRAKYGIDAEKYEAMLAAQNGNCAVCERPSKNTLHVDHCHATNKVRQLLCQKCNVGLGSFNDDPEVLFKAINYLRRHLGQ